MLTTTEYIPSKNYVIKKNNQYFCPKCDDWLFNSKCIHMAVCPNCGIQLDWDKEVKICK